MSSEDTLTLARKLCAEQAEHDCGPMVSTDDDWAAYYGRANRENNASLDLACRAIEAVIPLVMEHAAGIAEGYFLPESSDATLRVASVIATAIRQGIKL